MKNILFAKKPFVVGMIHLPPTMSFSGWPGIKKFIDKGKRDLEFLQKGGVDAALLENDEDQPCKIVGSADVIVPMTKAAIELSKVSSIPLGVEVLLNDPKASLTIAKIANLSFIRTDYFVDRMKRVGYGEFNIDPKGLMKYKNQIGAGDVSILTDIQVKYAAMLEDKTITESALKALKEGSDGMIVTGSKTGSKPLVSDLKKVNQVLEGRLPVIVGSGFSDMNAKKLLQYADGAIVGTSIKTGRFIDFKKVARLVEVVKNLT